MNQHEPFSSQRFSGHRFSGHDVSRDTFPGNRRIQGAGLGLRRAFIGALSGNSESDLLSRIDFLEVAPENWINVGGRFGRQFRALTEQVPFVLHGLSLSLGSPAPLDLNLLQAVKGFMHTHGITCYTEHLSYCSDDGHLYDLMPIPFTDEAVRYVAARIRQAQDVLECRIGIENVSYYAAPGQQMPEIDFLNAVLAEADCDLLLDVNNVYVNSINHGYDALDFLRAIPGQRIQYLHVAGHFNEAEDLLVDTHGASVIDPVWQLLGQAYDLFGIRPTLLERDFNIPPLPELVDEMAHIRVVQSEHHPIQNSLSARQHHSASERNT